MNKKAEALPRTYVIGILLFGIIITGFVSLFSQVGDDLRGDESEISVEQFNKTFNQLDNAKESTENLKNKLTGDDKDWGIWGVLNALIGSAWETLKILFTSFSFMNVAFYGLAMFGIPSWFISGIIAIITTILVFAVISAILKWNT